MRAFALELAKGSVEDVANGVNEVTCVIPTGFCVFDVMAGSFLMVRYRFGVPDVDMMEMSL